MLSAALLLDLELELKLWIGLSVFDEAIFVASVALFSFAGLVVGLYDARDELVVSLLLGADDGPDGPVLVLELERWAEGEEDAEPLCSPSTAFFSLCSAACVGGCLADFSLEVDLEVDTGLGLELKLPLALALTLLWWSFPDVRCLPLLLLG